MKLEPKNNGRKVKKHIRKPKMPALIKKTPKERQK